VVFLYHNNPTFCLIQEANAAVPECDYYPQSWYLDGIQQLYPHNPLGYQWSLEGNPENEPQNSGSSVQAVGGGWFNNQGSNLNNIRNEVYVPSYNHHLDTFDQSVWRQQGYMSSPRDWKNVEVSGLFYPCSDCQGAGQGPHSIDFVIRGAENSDSPPLTCAATNYHIAYGFTGADGGGKLERDIDHQDIAGYCQGCRTASQLAANTIPIVGLGHIFGFKVVLYNNVENTKVRMDVYLDRTGSGHEWQLIWSYVDKGGDPLIDSIRGQAHCQGERPDLPVTWAGPAIGFRMNASHLDYRQLTAVEIIPPVWH